MITRGMIYSSHATNDVADIVVGVEENMVLLVWVDDVGTFMWKKSTRLFRKEHIFDMDGRAYVQ